MRVSRSSKTAGLAVLATLVLLTASAKAEGELEIPLGTPEMKIEGQTPAPQGGRAILFSRSRHGNYPLATYSFSRGLRGDDKTVGNDVELVFGNAQRANAFAGPPVNSVPGAVGPRNGAAGMDGGGAGTKDQFRVGLSGTAGHRIVDLGSIDSDELTSVPSAAKSAGSDHAVVQAGHTYVLRLYDPNDRRYAAPIYVELRVLAHRDNDAVLIEWRRLES
jgi:hypothetical protein